MTLPASSNNTIEGGTGPWAALEARDPVERALPPPAIPVDAARRAFFCASAAEAEMQNTD